MKASKFGYLYGPKLSFTQHSQEQIDEPQSLESLAIILEKPLSSSIRGIRIGLQVPACLAPRRIVDLCPVLHEDILGSAVDDRRSCERVPFVARVERLSEADISELYNGVLRLTRPSRGPLEESNEGACLETTSVIHKGVPATPPTRFDAL
jgi:hypothetical protein